MEDGERRPQSHFEDYYWLGPDLTQNTRVCYILIFSAVLITTVVVRSSSLPIAVTDPVSRYPPVAWRLL